MIVSFVFTMDPIHENLSQTWVFYKAISFALKNHGAVIAQEHYFNGWDKQKKLFPQFFREDMCEMFEYDVPDNSAVQAIEKISIPKEYRREIYFKIWESIRRIYGYIYTGLARIRRIFMLEIK